MKIAALAALTILAAASPSLAAGWKGDANVFLGGKALDAGDWGPTDQQGELGLQTNFTGPEWPISLALDLLTSGRDGDIAQGPFTEQHGRTTEVDLGVRKLWTSDHVVRPYVGGGLAFASGELEKTGPYRAVSDSDNGVGLWIDAGLVWTVSRALNLGFDARISTAEIHLFGQDRNAGGLHLGLLLGYHWGA